MSRFFSARLNSLEAYTPGEQPTQRKSYIKLNTNESPFPPSKKAQAYAAEAAKQLQLYCDPTAKKLTQAVAERLGVDSDEVLLTNGSDEILNFAFMAFCDETHPVVFANITYGFYPVFAQLNCIPYEEIPLKSDFTIDVNDYIGINKTIVIANPNAPTGIALAKSDIIKIIESNPENVVIVDEAYVDFGGESCVDLIHKYDNLLVTQTFSKSRSMAGARLGFGVGCKALIADLNTIKYSTNPYNVNSCTQAAGLGCIEDDAYNIKNCQTIIENRQYTTKALRGLGFTVLDSKTNFVFAKHDKIGGEELYLKLKEAGILVRHFKKAEICAFNRISIGTKEQMESLISEITKILEGLQCFVQVR